MLPTLDHIRYLYKNTSKNESMLAFESSLRSWRTAVSDKLGLRNQVECGLQDAKHLRLTEEPKATAKPSNTSWRNARFSDCISENPKRAAFYCVRVNLNTCDAPWSNKRARSSDTSACLKRYMMDDTSTNSTTHHLGSAPLSQDTVSQASEGQGMMQRTRCSRFPPSKNAYISG